VIYALKHFLAADPIHTARLTGSIFTADLFGIIVVSDKSSRRGALPLSNPPKLRIADAKTSSSAIR
jgi:hypothetical protein